MIKKQVYLFRFISFNIIKNIIIILLLVISTVTYSAGDVIVNQICFNGLQRVSLDTALFSLPFKIGATINENTVANSIKILFFTGYFEEIEVINDNRGVFTIIVKERPMINTVKFYGNKTIKSAMIQEILNTKKIKSGNLLNNCALFAAKQELEDICYSFGKFNATVDIICTTLSRNRVDIQIKFFEGKTAKINDISIFGNYNFSEKQLLKQFKSYHCIKWKKILFNRTYQKQKIFYDLETLRMFYLNRGYAKFHVDDTRIDFDSNKDNIYLSLFITEGLKYVFQSLTVHGNVLNYIPKIREYLKIPSGEIYNHNRIQIIENNIRYILGKNGYLNPKILMEYNFDDCNKTVKLYLYIDVGDRFYVREIRFEGNDTTKDAVIRREIEHIEQTPFNSLNILEDQERLRRFSYFKQVDTRIEYIPDLFNQVDLVYKIEERNTGNLNLSMGIGTESGVNIQINMRQENFLGMGDSFSITANKNCYQTSLDISMLKRYIGIKRNYISGKIFYNNLCKYKINLSNYNMQNYGIDINYSYPISEYTVYNVGCNYISHNLSKITPQITVWRYLNSIGIDPLSLIKDNKLNREISFCANDLILVSGWVFNNLNRVYFPESGSRFSITGYMTLPESDNRYYKIIIDNNCYLSLDEDAQWILMNTVYVGYAAGLHKQIESPFYDNFCIGGISTIRGFRLNSIGPKAVYYDFKDSDMNHSICSIRNSQDTVGGNAVIFIRNELILPIALFVNNPEYSDATRISCFVDVGTVWDTYWKNTTETRAANVLDYSIFGHLRVSSGVSLKWISPIGPVIFSYSKAIKKYTGDMEEPFQFSIGQIW